MRRTRLTGGSSTSSTRSAKNPSDFLYMFTEMDGEVFDTMVVSGGEDETVDVCVDWAPDWRSLLTGWPALDDRVSRMFECTDSVELVGNRSDSVS